MDPINPKLTTRSLRIVVSNVLLLKWLEVTTLNIPVVMVRVSSG